MRLGAAAALLIAAASSTSSAEELQLADDITIPVLEGSNVPADCSAWTPDGPLVLDDRVVCVAFPIDSYRAGERNWDGEYLAALQAAGWSFVEGLGNVYTLERPGSADCPQQLYMAGWLRGERSEVQKFGTGAEGDMNWDLIPEGMLAAPDRGAIHSLFSE